MPWLSGRSELSTQNASRPSDFEKYDYSAIWLKKGLEDQAQKRILRGWIKPARSCLELGGGFGRITTILEPLFDDVIMLDVSRRSLAKAKSKLREAHLVRADALSIPLADSSFDCILMIRVVHLLPEPAKVMKEIQRVSRDGATFVLSVPNMSMNYLIHLLDGKFASRIRHFAPSFGPAIWPPGRSPHLSPQKAFLPDSFELKSRLGTGLFDNYLGKLLNRFRFLHLIDVATSPLWFLKLDVFMKFEIHK